MFSAHTRRVLVDTAYSAEENRKRALRGFEALALHPDDDPVDTAASDIIADVLLAFHAVSPESDAVALTERALRTYKGDFEDEVT